MARARVVSRAISEEIDRWLMSPEGGGFHLSQLMELAGLSVAHSIADVLLPSLPSPCEILVVSGPGNNGGDGLVAARHLLLMSDSARTIRPTVWLPRLPKADWADPLVRQCRSSGIAVHTGPEVPSLVRVHLVVDAVFGFGFQGPVKAPFDSALREISRLQREANAKVCSVDVPSGWEPDWEAVPEGTLLGPPDLLVSLSAPKTCATLCPFKTTAHTLGGRFLPGTLIQSLHLQTPTYPTPHAQHQRITEFFS